jgi:hypothetical protein
MDAKSLEGVRNKRKKRTLVTNFVYFVYFVTQPTAGQRAGLEDLMSYQRRTRPTST